MIGEHLNDIGEACQRLHRRIPGHAVDFRKVVLFDGILIVDDPAIGLNDLKRECAGCQNKCKQRIGVQCDRTEQIFQIRQRIDSCLRLGRRLRSWRRLRILREDWIDGRPCDKEGDCRSRNAPRAKAVSVFFQIGLLPASRGNMLLAIELRLNRRTII